MASTFRFSRPFWSSSSSSSSLARGLHIPALPCPAHNLAHNLAHKPATTTIRFHQRCLASSASKAMVGFIGLGNMGAPMACNLMKYGHPITVYDIDEKNLKWATDLGATAVGSPAEVAASADTVVTVLPASAHVRAVYTGPEGILSGCRPGAMFIDSSTIDPGTSMEMANRAVEKSACYMDAPISGGVMKAKAGSLSFMVGATKEEFLAATKILEAMGTTIIHCGPVSSGIVAKMCNNMLLAICMIGTSESMNMGIKLGLEPSVLAHVINSSSGSNWASTIYNPVPGVIPGIPPSNEYQGGFLTSLMTKDLGLVQDLATASGSPIPLGSAAHQIYKMLNNSGFDGKDFSVVYKFLSSMAESKEE